MCRLVVVLALGVAMAKPPEPLEEIFPLTALIVDAEVVGIKHTAKPDGTDASPEQVVVLRVARVVRGALAEDETREQRVIAIKPKGAYSVRVGVKGPWLLTAPEGGERTVLGRYGPDSWTFEKLERKLKELDPPHLRATKAL